MPIEEFNPSENNPFVSGQDGFEDELGRRSRVIVTPDTHVEVASKKPSNWSEPSSKEKRRFIGVGAGVAAVAVASIAAAPEIVDQLNGPEYSAETTSYTVEQGDGWWDVIEAIDGHEQIDQNDLIAHVQADPANIDVLTQGELTPGQSIVIPVSVEK